MNSIANIYALTSVTLRGDMMLIPAWHFETNKYPFDLQIILPNFLFTSKKTIISFLKFLNLVDFHYKGRLIISAGIIIETNSLLDKLNKVYLRNWKAHINIVEVPERRRLVEQEIIKWSAKLPKTLLGQFIHRYYSVSIKKTDWRSKGAIWRSLRQKISKKPKISAKKIEKLKEKYSEIWFKYFDKITFSNAIQSNFPEFTEEINRLTFKDILPEIQMRLCPVCETDMSSYAVEIQYCPQCGYALFESVQNFCSNCGVPLRKKTSFCSNCGKKIEKR
ncbi:MAG: zinc ribbon domain-containing protein [Promethearchaeota archaeon]